MKIVAVVVALLLTASLTFAAGAVNLNSTRAKEILAKNPKVLVLDVRTPEEYRQARLTGAKLIPLNELERRVKEIPRDRPLLVYCAVGARSDSAARLLASKGFKEIYHMSDGIVGWYKNGYPVEKGR